MIFLQVDIQFPYLPLRNLGRELPLFKNSLYLALFLLLNSLWILNYFPTPQGNIIHLTFRIRLWLIWPITLRFEKMTHLLCNLHYLTLHCLPVGKHSLKLRSQLVDRLTQSFIILGLGFDKEFHKILQVRLFFVGVEDVSCRGLYIEITGIEWH